MHSREDDFWAEDGVAYRLQHMKRQNILETPIPFTSVLSFFEQEPDFKLSGHLSSLFDSMFQQPDSFLLYKFMSSRAYTYIF